MLRKKSALHMDARYSTMIENTFYVCDPPKNAKNVSNFNRFPNSVSPGRWESVSWRRDTGNGSMSLPPHPHGVAR